MAKRDCPIKLDECSGADSPITNASSEAPDPLLFAGIGWTNFDPFAPRPLGNGPAVAVDCSNITWNAESQELADLLAAINAAFCQPPIAPPIPGVPPLHPPWLPPNGGGQDTFPPFPPITPNFPTADFGIQPTREFTNDRQFAQVNCPDGSVFGLEIPAGTVIGGPFTEEVGAAWVEYINAWLLASLLQQLNSIKVCIIVPDLTERTEPGTPPIPPPGPGGGPASIFNYPGWCCLGSALVAGQNTYTISGSSNTWSFSASGIPPGTALVQTGPRTAVLVGTPSTAGTYNIAIIATYASSTITINDTLHVFGLLINTLPGANEGQPYSEQLQAAGGNAPYTFSDVSGLPGGLSMASDGTISGTPTESGPFTITVTITDS